MYPRSIPPSVRGPGDSRAFLFVEGNLYLKGAGYTCLPSGLFPLELRTVS